MASCAQRYFYGSFYNLLNGLITEKHYLYIINENSLKEAQNGTFQIFRFKKSLSKNRALSMFYAKTRKAQNTSLKCKWQNPEDLKNARNITLLRCMAIKPILEMRIITLKEIIFIAITDRIIVS